MEKENIFQWTEQYPSIHHIADKWKFTVLKPEMNIENVAINMEGYTI